MATRKLSLWLTAQRHDETQRKLRGSISSIQGSPHFEPHITLHSFSASDVHSVEKKLREFVSKLPTTLTMKFNPSITLGEQYFMSAYLQVTDEGKSKLLPLKQQAMDVFGPDVLGRGIKEFTPHLSLHYGADPAVRKEAHSQLSASLPSPAQLAYTITGIELVDFDGPESSWSSICRAPLGSKWAFHTLPFINGKWANPVEGKFMPVINPANCETFHHVGSSSEADVKAAVSAAQKAFDKWGTTSVAERSKYLIAIADKLTERKQLLAEYETLDNGKVLKESLMDIDDAAACFKYYANEIQKLEKEEQDQSIDVENAQFDCYVRQEPVGVCGLVIPFNYPLLMAAWKVAPCLAAGCTAILKPSELTPITALELADVCAEVGLPAGVLNVLPGGAEAGSAITEHPDIAKVAFTGSVATGCKVAEAGAKSVKKVSLELGGKSPIIVFEDADLEQCVDWITVGIFFNQGQVCSATSRLLVQESVKDKLMQRLVEVSAKIKLGDGMNESSTMGPIVSQRQWEKVNSYIDKGLDEGATLRVGGKVSEPELMGGLFVKPTIFDNVSDNMTIWKEEIFGPVLCVKTFKMEEEAIKIANQTEFGLAASIMSKDKERLKRVSRQLQAGIVWINCSQPTFVQAPWGGMKKSGVGRELGPWGLKNYLETKQITSWVDQSDSGWHWFVPQPNKTQ